MKKYVMDGYGLLLRILMTAAIVAICVQPGLGMSRMQCPGGYKINPVNMYGVLPGQIVYLSYEAYADNKFLLGLTCDVLFTANYWFFLANFSESEGLPMPFYFANFLIMSPLVINSYVSMAESLQKNDTAKIIRSVVGIVLPIVALSFGGACDYCDKDGKTEGTFYPVFGPEYAGLEMNRRF